jgi:zinc protease
MKRTVLTAFVAVLGLALLPGVGARAAPTPEIGVHAEKSVLANGLEVILDEDHRTPVVTVNIWYHVGSKNEAEHRNGFAHLFEHMMFQGSKHVAEDTYFKYLEQAGATTVNGTTNVDRTNYFETVPSNQLELALWLESDRMGFLLDHADQKTFASQRDVVKNERRQNYENAPYGFVTTAIREQLFPPAHPYHRLTIGNPADLDAASLDDVRAFFRTNYVPNNATLVLSGDFDKAKAKALVEKYFGPIPRGADVPRKTAMPAPHPGETRIEMEAGVELARVYVNWPSPPHLKADDAELDLLAKVLASGKTSRLYKRLVYDLQIAQSVIANQSNMEIANNFDLVVTAKSGHTADEVLKAVDEELAKLRAGGIKDDELSRAKAATIADNLFELERSSQRANTLNSYNHFVGDPNWLAQDIARTNNATAESVMAAARKWITEKDRVVTVVTPKKDAPTAGRVVAIIGAQVAREGARK